MAVGELARLLHAVNTILDDAATALDLSRRATFAIAMMGLDEKRAGMFDNNWIRDQFLEFNISTMLSVQKDASAAKTELQEKGCIQIGLRPKEFSITENGRAKIKMAHEVLETAIAEMELSPSMRRMIRELLSPSQAVEVLEPSSPRHQPQNTQSATSAREKRRAK